MRRPVCSRVSPRSWTALWFAICLAVAHVMSACGGCGGHDGGIYSIETTLVDASGSPVDDAIVTCTIGMHSFSGTLDRGTYVCGGGAGSYTLRVMWRGAVVVSRAVEVPEANACLEPRTVYLSFVLTSPPPSDAGPSSDATIDGAREQ